MDGMGIGEKASNKWSSPIPTYDVHLHAGFYEIYNSLIGGLVSGGSADVTKANRKFVIESLVTKKQQWTP